MLAHHRETCVSCGSAVHEIIDLGMHPMADTFIPAARRYEADRIYPLICDLCESCGQIQLRTITDPEERYSHFDYSYTSSNSQFSRNHWTKYAAEIATRLRLERGQRVVEIGSNDGFLAERFLDLGFAVTGVDPSAAMCELAAKRGVSTLNRLFNSEVATQLAGTLDAKPALIVANNVFNHANDPRDFAKGVSRLLGRDGTFVFELPYFRNTISDERFDQIYHEHVSYLTVTHARNLFRSINMSVVHVDEVDYHGGSIRVFVRHHGKEDDTVERCVSAEQRDGLFDQDTYEPFMQRIKTKRDQFMTKVFALKNSGAKVVCIGAAAKANTFMSFYNLDASVIDWVTDASPSKIGKYTPGTRVPIGPDNVIADYDKVYAIVTSWNLAATLRDALRQINPRVEFLDPNEA